MHDIEHNIFILNRFLCIAPNILDICDLNWIGSSHLVSRASLLPAFGHQNVCQNFLSLGNISVGVWPCYCLA